jgi:hypothetical protein
MTAREINCRALRATAQAVFILALLLGCGSADPLSITCGGFLNKDDAAQLTLATTWGAPNRDHIGPAEKLAGPAYKASLVSYCTNHEDVHLSDISLR